MPARTSKRRLAADPVRSQETRQDIATSTATPMGALAQLSNTVTPTALLRRSARIHKPVTEPVHDDEDEENLDPHESMASGLTVEQDSKITTINTSRKRKRDVAGSHKIIDPDGVSFEDMEKYELRLKFKIKGKLTLYKYKCLLCKHLLSRSGRDFQRHWRTHFSKAQFACDVCGQTGFVQRSNLEEHKRKKHEKKATLLCGFCPKKFIDSSSLSRHRNDRHGDVHVKGSHTTVGKQMRAARRKAQEEAQKAEISITDGEEDEEAAPMKAPPAKRRKRSANTKEDKTPQAQPEDPVTTDGPKPSSSSAVADRAQQRSQSPSPSPPPPSVPSHALASPPEPVAKYDPYSIVYRSQPPCMYTPRVASTYSGFNYASTSYRPANYDHAHAYEVRTAYLGSSERSTASHARGTTASAGSSDGRYLSSRYAAPSYGYHGGYAGYAGAPMHADGAPYPGPSSYQGPLASRGVPSHPSTFGNSYGYQYQYRH
ncbi:hypothetical protein K474DRAFT_819658 [Panus rudis PR-1116 ss-1]|nr:hypothetical protein K474DRAFT_819658 [Panus rudis PR-1116 ss-1]